jgi:SnoaL-like domain
MTLLKQAADLLLRFDEATTAFNNQDLNTYSKFLHPKILVRQIHAPSTHQGKNKAISLWKKKFGNKPQFKPHQPVTVDGATGIVEGTAVWEDTHQKNRIAITISYRFIFVHDPVKGWLIAHLHAHRRG